MSDKEERVDQPEDQVPGAGEPPVTPPDIETGEISPAEAAALEDEAVADRLPAEVDVYVPGDPSDRSDATAVGAPDLTWADEAARAAAAAEAGVAPDAGEPAPKTAVRTPLGVVRRAEMSLFWERAAVGVVFLIVYVVLLLRYRPDLMLSQTTTSGGDMGAHHYPAWYMHTYLLPHLKLTGWSMQWYAGMPMFTFYLPLPFAADRAAGFRHPVHGGVQAGDRPGGLRTAPRGVRVRPAAAPPTPVRPYRRRRRAGLPGDGELLDLRRQHPEHARRASSASRSVSR